MQEEHDAVSWLVLEGTVLLFDWCEPLSVLGHGDEVSEFLVWSTLAMESMVSLSTVKVPGFNTHGEQARPRQRSGSCIGMSRAGSTFSQS